MGHFFSTFITEERILGGELQIRIIQCTGNTFGLCKCLVPGASEYIGFHSDKKQWPGHYIFRSVVNLMNN